MATSVYDLHAHSTCSDGALSPTDLVTRAAGRGVTHLALTDHDTLAGLAEAQMAATHNGIELINGVEISVTWQRKPLHIVGLGFDIGDPVLNSLLEELQLTRRQRAEKIAAKLAKKGVKEPLEHASRHAQGRLITRPHFARCLIEQGFATDFESAFANYLGQGKPGFVSTEWVSMENALEALHGAGGVAIIAHPRRYRLTHSWMRRLLEAFKAMGGEAVEVVTGGGSPGDVEAMTQLAIKFDLLASVGSDFHDPINPWIELGKLAPLPAALVPVWKALSRPVQNKLAESTLV